MSDVEKKIKSIVLDRLDNLSIDEINPMAKLTEDLGADSLTIVEIIMELEDTFDIEISDNDIDEKSTIDDIIKYIEAKV
jgi:acyl carrier protein